MNVATSAGVERRRGEIAAVTALATIGAVSAGLTVAAIIGSDGADSAPANAVHVAAGVAFLAVGVVAALRRPRNHTGLLMVCVGVTWFVIDLQRVPSPVAYTVGNLLGIITWASLAHLVLAFPGGLLRTGFNRALVAAVYAWMLLGNLLTETLFAAPPGDDASPHILLVLHASAAQNHTANAVQLSVNLLLGVVALGALLARWRVASRPGRRAIAPVLWASGPIFLVVLGLDITGLVTSPAWLTASLPVLEPAAMLTLPLAFLAGMLRSSLARLALGHLVVELHEAPTHPRLRDALARALGDPTLTIAYRVASSAEWLDESGRTVQTPRDGGGRATTLLERDGETIAALTHDTALDDPALIESVAAAAALALDNERLHAEVRAQLAEVRASRTRIIEAADDERRRLQRDIHDGAQQRLVALSMRVGKLRDRTAGADSAASAELTAISDQLSAAISELRELSSGIHPSILVEAGLGPALQALADTAALPVRLDTTLDGRLPDAVEAAAYFIVSESLANAAKHSGARAVTVSARCQNGLLLLDVSDDGTGGAERSRGSGLSGLADRVAALDGRLSVESPAGGGTRIAVALPCA